MKWWISVSLVVILLVSIWSDRFVRAVPVRQRVFLIGLDGASWNLIDPLMQQGKLPNLQSLIRTGTRASLKTLTPTWSPLLWTSIATGKLPAKHGIQASLAGNGKLIIEEGNQRKTKAFWNILSDRGMKVGLVNWWITWPAEKVNGFVVSDRYRRSRNEAGLTYPAELLHRLPKVGVTPLGFEYDKKHFHLPSTLEAIVPMDGEESINYKVYWGQDKAVRDASLQLLKETNIDVFAVVFRIVDVSSHVFWKFLSEGKRNDQEYSALLEPIYMYADQIVGQFLRLADRNTSIIICSDHGFELIGNKYDHNKRENPPAGILILNGSPFRTGYKLKEASVLDVTPTLLQVLHLPVGKDMDGKVLSSAFKKFVKPVYVRSHDVGPRPEQTPVNELDAETKEDFRALGYIQ